MYLMTSKYQTLNSGHYIDLDALGINNIVLQYFKPNTTGRFQACDLLYFAVLKNKYRSYLRVYRQEKQVCSPGLETSVKTAAQLANTMSPKTIRACWKRMGLKRFQNLEVSFSITILIKYFQDEQLPNEAEELERHRIERAEEELGLLQIFENMAIGREDQNEDEDLDVVVVEDQNVQDQNQAMEQDLDDQNLADEVQKAQAEENKVQTSILSFFKKK